jgi:hypothetical protein
LTTNHNLPLAASSKQSIKLAYHVESTNAQFNLKQI